MGQISVVIPTYNRREQLSEVLDCLLKSDVDELSKVEIIVIDDGSTVPTKSVVESKQAKTPFTLKYFYQNNAGPAEARNHGFRRAECEIVLFIDDDILVFPDLIKKHFQAHQKLKGSVVFGQNLYIKPKSETSSYRFLEYTNTAEFSKKNKIDEGFVEAVSVASGNLSVEKHLFSEENAVYTSRLRMPFSEEFDLAFRLKERHIPIYSALDIKGWHLQPTDIEDKCKQEYRYGVLVAGVAVQNPSALALGSLKNMFESNRGVQNEDAFPLKLKKSVRKMLAQKFVREKMLRTINLLGKIVQKDSILFPLYKIIVGTYFFAGVRDGIKIFQNDKKSKPEATLNRIKVNDE